jgi:hypothetical protein
MVLNHNLTCWYATPKIIPHVRHLWNDHIKTLRYIFAIQVTARSIGGRFWVELNGETTHINAVDALEIDVLEKLLSIL